MKILTINDRGHSKSQLRELFPPMSLFVVRGRTEGDMMHCACGYLPESSILPFHEVELLIRRSRVRGKTLSITLSSQQLKPKDLREQLDS